MCWRSLVATHVCVSSTRVSLCYLLAHVDDPDLCWSAFGHASCMSGRSACSARHARVVVRLWYEGGTVILGCLCVHVLVWFALTWPANRVLGSFSCVAGSINC